MLVSLGAEHLHKDGKETPLPRSHQGMHGKARINQQSNFWKTQKMCFSGSHQKTTYMHFLNRLDIDYDGVMPP